MTNMEVDEVESSGSEEDVKVDFVESARNLAANTLKLRENAFKSLQRDLFSSERVLEREECLCIWKGLFFMMWHSDGLEVQEKLCERIAKMTAEFKLPKNRFTFLQSFLEIHNREWMGIDRLRMSKFMLLCRLMLRQNLEQLAKADWAPGDVEWLIGVLGVGPLQSHQPVGKTSCPAGLRYHFVDIWVEELLRVGGSKSNVGKPAPTEIVNRLVFCWAKTAALTNIGAFRQKIKQNILEELIERSEVSMKVLRQHADSVNGLEQKVAEMENDGTLDLDFEKLAKDIIDLTDDTEKVNQKQRKAMNRIVIKLRSLAAGDLPMEDISDWSVEPTEIDKFLYQTQNGFSKKAMKYMQGLTSAKNLPDNIGEKLEEFLKDDMPDDHRVAPKPKDKRKSKKAKQLERAKRKRKLMNEVLAEENNNRVLQEQERIAEPEIFSPEEEPEIPTQNKAQRLKALRMAKKEKKKKALQILVDTRDEVPIKAKSKEPVNTAVEKMCEDSVGQCEGESGEVIEVKSRKKEDTSQKLADLAKQIRLSMDNEEEEAQPSKKGKGGKGKLKGDQLQFVQLKEEKSEPKATAFLTHAQRKAMKKQKKVKIVPKAAQQMLKKDTKLTFNQELVQIKPFKKLDKPEVVGSHQGELNVHKPEVTPTKSALRVKTTPRKIVGNKGKLKWQG